MSRAIIVREKVSRLIKLLVEQKISVTQRGSNAYVQYDSKGYPTTINIPYIPDDATEQFMNAVEGFLDHEVAHVLFSDYAALKKAKKHGVGQMANIIEDSFIERMMADSFQGSGLNLSNVGEFFLKNFTDKKIKEEPEHADAYLIVPAIRAYAGQTVYKDYMKDKWHLIKPIDEKIREYSEKTLPFIKNSDEATDAAIEIKKLLEEAPDESEGEGDEGKPSKKGKKGKGKKGEGKGSSSPDEATTPEGEESGPEDEGSDPEDSDDSDEGEGPTGDTGEDESPEGSMSMDEHPDREPEDSPPIDFKSLSEKMKDFDDALASVLSSEAVKEAKSSDYMVYTKDFDKIEPMEVGHRGRWDDSMLKSMQDKVDHLVGPLQKDLERAIAARSQSIWSSGHRSGRLHASALARLTAFHDDRAFRRKHVNETKDVAVQLVIDCSGSMMGSKIELAAYTAYALMMVLERLGISCEVIGFTTDRGMPREYSKEESRLGIRYARNEALYIPIMKGFGERASIENKKRLAALPEVNWLSENVDGESIQIAGSRLIVRREKRKIMIVLSDGHPACPGDRTLLYAHLKNSVSEIEKAGIDVLGIGIQSSAPKNFYSKYVLIDNISELPSTVIAQMKRLLMQG